MYLNSPREYQGQSLIENSVRRDALERRVVAHIGTVIKAGQNGIGGYIYDDSSEEIYCSDRASSNYDSRLKYTNNDDGSTTLSFQNAERRIDPVQVYFLANGQVEMDSKESGIRLAADPKQLAQAFKLAEDFFQQMGRDLEKAEERTAYERVDQILNHISGQTHNQIY